MFLERFKGLVLVWGGEGVGCFIKGLCFFILMVFDLEGWGEGFFLERIFCLFGGLGEVLDNGWGY